MFKDIHFIIVTLVITLVMKSLKHQIHLYAVKLTMIHTYSTTCTTRLQLTKTLSFITTMKFYTSKTQHQMQHAMNLIIQLTIHSITLRRHIIPPLIMTMMF